MIKHSDECPRPLRDDCLEFSTDGTRMGSEIAHAMGTDDEYEIQCMQDRGKVILTGMYAEQADWESDLYEAP